MLKVSKGHYRDTFRRQVYDVFKSREIAGTRTIDGWRFRIHAFGKNF